MHLLNRFVLASALLAFVVSGHLLRADGAPPAPVVHYRPESTTYDGFGAPPTPPSTPSTRGVVAPAPGVLGDDATIKRTLLGVWTGGRYDHRLDADGNLYENGRVSCKWDVKGGRYYEVFNSPTQPDNAYDIIILTPNIFCYRYHPNGEMVTWSRVGPNGGRITTSTPASALAPLPGMTSPPGSTPLPGAATSPIGGAAPQPPAAMKNGDTANRPVVGDPSTLTADNAHDLELKKKLLGYWESPRHDYCYATDGFCYMMQGATSTHTWDITNGLYYEGPDPCNIIALTNDTFTFRTQKDGAIYTIKRTTKENAEQYTF